MTSTRAEAAYLRSLAAFRNPTLDLLHGRYAPFVVAALSTIFTSGRPAVAVADAHAEIGEILDQLRGAGYGVHGAEDQAGESPTATLAPAPAALATPNVPTVSDGDEDGDEGAAGLRLPSGTARDICRYWVKVGWLSPQIEHDVEVYRLSAHAVRALEIAGRVSGRGTRVSSSRVLTLMDAVERLAGDAETDPAARLARLEQERADLDHEIAQLRAGDVAPVDDEQLLEEAENVLHLARELPADFSRVAESLKSMQRDVVSDLRQDLRPTGEVLHEYLQRGQHVMEATPEGRAFSGALRLIGDPETTDRLTAELRSLLLQPFARMMDVEQRAELATIGRKLEEGVAEVLTAQRRASHVITQQVRIHDPARDRHVDALLREVMSQLQVWMQGSRPKDRIEPLRGFPVADVAHLRRSLSDIRPPVAPPPLASAQDVEFLDADTASWGGPNYEELETYVAGLGESFDLASAFEAAAEDSRRPVDLLGLLEIAHRNGMTENQRISVVEARRPDGTSRSFAFGAVTARTNQEEGTHE